MCFNGPKYGLSWLIEVYMSWLKTYQKLNGTLENSQYISENCDAKPAYSMSDHIVFSF